MPTAPPAYRPQPIPKVLQAKTRLPQRPHLQSGSAPVVMPTSKIQPHHPQAKSAQHVATPRRGPAAVPAADRPARMSPVPQRKSINPPSPATSRLKAFKGDESPAPSGVLHTGARTKTSMPKPRAVQLARRSAFLTIGSMSAGIIQRAEDDRYAKQNCTAMKALLAVGRKVQEGDLSLLTVREEDFRDERVAKKFSKDTTTTVKEVILIKLAQLDFRRLIEEKEPGFSQRFCPVLFSVKREMCVRLLWPQLSITLGTRQLKVREAHANARNLLPHVVDIPTVMRGCTDIVKWAWYGYAITMTVKADVPVQWAEIMSGGITSRIIYDWWNEIFYITPHYSDWEETKAKLPSQQKVNLDFQNPYVKLIGTEGWRERKPLSCRHCLDDIARLQQMEAAIGADEREALLRTAVLHNQIAELTGQRKLTKYDVLLDHEREFTKQDLAIVPAAMKRFLPK